MIAKGFQRVELTANPDLVVLYHAALGEQTELNTVGMGWGARWGGGGRTTVDKIPTGQVTIDIGDAKTKKLAWMGTARDTLTNNPQKDEKNLNKALDKMFKKFPPPKGKKQAPRIFLAYLCRATTLFGVARTLYRRFRRSRSLWRTAP